MQLTEPYFASGRRIFFDNFFTSIPLAEDLISKNLLCVGTLRKNKKEIPVEFHSALNSEREIGSRMNVFKDEIMMTSWIAKKGKHILMLSTDPDVMPRNSGNNSNDSVGADDQEKQVNYLRKLSFYVPLYMFFVS